MGWSMVGSATLLADLDEIMAKLVWRLLSANPVDVHDVPGQ
jgi:hypothetical protein